MLILHGRVPILRYLRFYYSRFCRFCNWFGRFHVPINILLPPFLIRQLLLDILGLAGRGVSGCTLIAYLERRHRNGGTPAARMQRRIVNAGFMLRKRKLALIQSAAHCAGLEVECCLEPIGLDTCFPVSLFGSFSRHMGALGVDERCRAALGHAHALGKLFRHAVERVAADKAA